MNSSIVDITSGYIQMLACINYTGKIGDILQKFDSIDLSSIKKSYLWKKI